MSLARAAHTWADMIKLGHSIFALPFAMVGAFLAGRALPAGMPAWGQLGLLVVCMVTARSCAMTFNRIIDAQTDFRNPRTRQRPLPAGRITTGHAWIFFAAAAILFVLSCLGFGILYHNYWPVLLSLPVLLYLCGYSYCKWYTRWSHFYLGSAIALSPAAAWLAVHPESIGMTAVILVAAVTFWIAGFDIIYACQDIDFDRREGLHAIPAKLGPRRALWIARSAHVVTVILLALLGAYASMGWLYWLGIGFVALLLTYENAIVHADDLSRVNVAFFTVNGVVSVVMGACSVADVLLDLQPIISRGV